MSPATLQVPSIILPTVWSIGTETETVADLLEHTSIEVPVEFLQEKQVHIFATEVGRAIGVIVGGPFMVGEAIVGVPSGATGLVMAQGANWIEIFNIAGVFAVGDVITGVVSGAFINGGLAFAVPGNLWCWVELSPYPSANSTYWAWPLPTTTAYWAAIGGGGGFLAPTAPLIEVGTGINGVVHSILIPWTQHSAWARLIIQTPVAAALPNALWLVQAIFSAKGW